MTDIQKFDLFNKTHSWKSYQQFDKHIVEFKPIGAKYSEYKGADTLQGAFARVFNYLGY